jgi:serine phosphatase RsbU (regulator of sigma subunit)
MPSSSGAGPLGGRSVDHDSLGYVLLHTLPGRALVIGTAVRLGSSLLQRVVGPSALLDAIGTVGTLALLGATGYFTWRLVALAKRRLLWRVRRKLILSYIFVGLVPALLIIIFFALCGWLLFSSVSSYVIQTRFRGLTERAEFIARATAGEAAATTSLQAVTETVRRRHAEADERYPGAAIVLVPANRTCPGAPQRPGGVAAAAPLVAGAWTHVEAPGDIPAWIGCEGFSGLMVGPGTAEASPGTSLYVRAVAFPAAAAPRHAVVVDIPLTAEMVRQTEEETGISIGSIGDAAPGASTARDERTFAQWVVFLQHTRWATGDTGQVTLAITMRIADVYAQLSPAGIRDMGQWLLFIIGLVGLMFLLIQFVALVMGLALARSITGSVHELFVGTERVRQGDFSHRIRVFARDQLGELADSFNSMTARLAQLLAEMTEKKRLEEELRIARDIQMSLLPQQAPTTLPGVSITAVCSPAREVGGDYYDFFPLGDRRLGVLIADVSGKGTSAAFYMAELKGVMLSLSQMHRSPRELLVHANRIIADHLDNRSFITVTYAILDLDVCTITWARAGHTPLIHLRRGPDGERRARVLVSDGLVLGLKIDNGERFDALLEEVTMPLAAGDLFVLFTDGLSEQMNAGEELFGEERLGVLVEEHGDLPCDELRERILREVTAFAGGTPQHDDLTFILLRVDELPAEVAEAAGRAARDVVTVRGPQPVPAR